MQKFNQKIKDQTINTKKENESGELLDLKAEIC